MTGYGNKTPRSLTGQLFIIPFASIGIPLTVCMLNSIGQNICYFVELLVKLIEKKLRRKDTIEFLKVKLMFSVFFLLVLLLVVMAVVSIFWEKWSFGKGIYVWFVTFTTIGFGDFIPGNASDSKDTGMAIVYRCAGVLLGLSLVSTLFNAFIDFVEEKQGNANSKSMVGYLMSAFSYRKRATDIVNDEKGARELAESITPTINAH